MPQATLAELADEMASQIETVLDAADEEIQVVSRMNLNPDGFAIDIYPADPFGTEDAAGQGDIVGSFFWVVRARISGDRDAEQDLLLQLMDDTSDLSVAAALESDPTLNGLASDIAVTGPSGYTFYVDGEGTRLGVEWRVQVLRAYS